MDATAASTDTNKVSIQALIVCMVVSAAMFYIFGYAFGNYTERMDRREREKAKQVVTTALADFVRSYGRLNRSDVEYYVEGTGSDYDEQLRLLKSTLVHKSYTPHVNPHLHGLPVAVTACAAHCPVYDSLLCAVAALHFFAAGLLACGSDFGKGTGMLSLCCRGYELHCDVSLL